MINMYRVLEKQRYDGKKYYVVQKRELLLWDQIRVHVFDSLEEAKEYIRYSKLVRKYKIVYKE